MYWVISRKLDDIVSVPIGVFSAVDGSVTQYFLCERLQENFSLVSTRNSYSFPVQLIALISESTVHLEIDCVFFPQSWKLAHSEFRLWGSHFYPANRPT